MWNNYEISTGYIRFFVQGMLSSLEVEDNVISGLLEMDPFILTLLFYYSIADKTQQIAAFKRLSSNKKNAT